MAKTCRWGMMRDWDKYDTRVRAKAEKAKLKRRERYEKIQRMNAKAVLLKMAEIDRLKQPRGSG